MWSKPALLLLAMWGTGNVMIIYLSGLQDVPVHLLEAAELDGAPQSNTPTICGTAMRL